MRALFKKEQIILTLIRDRQLFEKHPDIFEQFWPFCHFRDKREITLNFQKKVPFKNFFNPNTDLQK